MSKGDFANQSLGGCGRRQLIGYALAPAILVHMTRVSDDGGEHSVLQTYFLVSVKPP